MTSKIHSAGEISKDCFMSFDYLNVSLFCLLTYLCKNKKNLFPSAEKLIDDISALIYRIMKEIFLQ